jgi:hypothetical protein
MIATPTHYAPVAYTLVHILDQYLVDHVIDAANPPHLFSKGSQSLNGMVFEPLDDERAHFP